MAQAVAPVALPALQRALVAAMAAGRLVGALLVLQLLTSPRQPAASAADVPDAADRCDEDGQLRDGEAAFDSETAALLQLGSTRPSSERRPLEVAGGGARPEAGARSSSESREDAKSNASEVLPGARLWLSQRGLDQIALDVFPVLLARVLEKDIQSRSGSCLGFDWSLSNLRVAEVQLRPPVLRLSKGTGILMGLHGGFDITGNYSIRGRSWYGFLRSEGNFSIPLERGSEVGGIMYLGISALGKPTITLANTVLQLSTGSLKANGFFASSLLSVAARGSLEADIAKHMESAVSTFVNRDVSLALSELDLSLPVKLPAPHDVLSYDLSLTRILLASSFAVVDLSAKPLDRERPERAYPAEPAAMPLVPPLELLRSSRLALSTSPWAADGALWILNQTGPPAGTAERGELNVLLAEEIAQSLSADRTPAGSASTTGAVADSPFGLALLGRQASQGAVARRVGFNSTSGTATALVDDFRWDLTPLLARKYGHSAASMFSALASELAASAGL